MNILKLFYVFFKMRLLSPIALYKLISSIYKYGINLTALLGFAARTYGNNTALADDNEILSYKELLSQSERLSAVLQNKYKLKDGSRAGLLCKNHGSLIKSIFAVSLSGADIYLLNTEMSSSQLTSLISIFDFDLLIYDFELTPLIEQSNYKKHKILSYHESMPSVNSLINTDTSEDIKLKRASLGKLVILTGGTTGNFKAAAHKPSLFNFLNPFLTLLTRLKLLNYKIAYIATPIYHGYGVAVLLLCTALGNKMVISKGFSAEKACRLIREHNVDVVNVVPLMLYKMLKHSTDDLKSLCCIVSGSAELNPRLAEETLSSLGDILYNLYGTSEAGLNIIATPQDLRYSPKTIGRKIHGVRLKILDDSKKKVGPNRIGRLCIKNNWSIKNSKDSWIETGDLGYRDSSGYYFLCGRVDDMVVSAGENVYPIEVEQVLIKHPQVEDAAVIGVSDEIFGQRLKAFVLPAKNAGFTEKELFEWLRGRVARFQMPKEITFVDNMPYTPLGKLDKKQLK